MIPSQYYQYFFLFVATILTVFYLAKFKFKPLVSPSQQSISFGLWLLFIAVTLYIGFRDPYSPIFGDTQAYTLWYERQMGDIFTLDFTVDNLIFDNLFHFMSSARVPLELFYLTIATIYFGGTLICVHALFKDKAYLAFLVWLVAFSTFSYSTNGIKAGAAASLFLVALAFRLRRKHILAILFLILSIGFHHSMRVPVVAYFVCSFFKKPKYYTIFWIICFIISALHISFFQELFASFGDEKAIGYLTSNEGYFKNDLLGGFRIDFILYSSVPILLGWYAMYKKNIQSAKYTFLLNLYTFVNGIWLLCIYASFTNRIAYLSWLMYPIVLMYPLLNEEWGYGQQSVIKKTVLGHLAFTLFMAFIYY